MPVGVRRGVVPALLVDDDHDVVEHVTALQLKVGVELVEEALHHGRHPLAGMVELGALLPVVDGAVLDAADDDGDPELGLGLNPPPAAIRAALGGSSCSAGSALRSTNSQISWSVGDVVSDRHSVKRRAVPGPSGSPAAAGARERQADRMLCSETARGEQFWQPISRGRAAPSNNGGYAGIGACSESGDRTASVSAEQSMFDTGHVSPRGDGQSRPRGASRGGEGSARANASEGGRSGEI